MTRQQRDALGFIDTHPGCTQTDLRREYGWGTSKAFEIVEFLSSWGFVTERRGYEVAGAHKSSRCFYSRWP